MGLEKLIDVWADCTPFIKKCCCSIHNNSFSPNPLLIFIPISIKLSINHSFSRIKNITSMASSTLLWSLVLVFFQCHIFSNGEKVQSVPVDAKELVNNRMRCYVCNSDNKNQGNCTSSDLEQLKEFITVCPPLTEGPLAGTEANSCRKVLQSFGEENNVVRECAYTGTEPVDGKRRTGNKGITLYIYQCFNEKNDNPCNSALRTGTFSMLTSLLGLFTTFAVIQLFWSH